MGSTSEVFVGSIDQGTTSSRFLIFNKQGEPVASHQLEFKQIYPQPGCVSSIKACGPLYCISLTCFSWHEHDPLEIVSSVEKCIDGAVAQFETQGHNINSIKAIGITNQRETTVLWDQQTGEPLYNAIVWTDTRTQNMIRKIKHRLGADLLNEISGLPLSTYPSVGKLLWLLENEPKVKTAYDKGVLAFGTIDAWLVYKLNGGTNCCFYLDDSGERERETNSVQAPSETSSSPTHPMLLEHYS